MADLPHDSSNPNSKTEKAGGQHTVIIGAGIIGCATAYYLSRTTENTDTIHLVESSPELFASASGKSGGFLAGDWFEYASASLGQLSFRLHQELADEHNGPEKWGYSRSTGTSFTEGREARNKHAKPDQDWLAAGGSRAEQASGGDVHEFKSHEEDGSPTWLNKRRGDRVDMLGEKGSVAQVDPLRLSQFLLRESLASGVQLHQPAKALRLTNDGLVLQLTSGTAETRTIPCTRLLIAAGAWTPRVFASLFPQASCKIRVSPYAGHSLVMRSPRWTKNHEPGGCHAVFASMRHGFSPEIFSRMGEEVYIAGLNSSSIPLPELATEAVINSASIEELRSIATRFLGEKDVQVVREGLCFRPVTPRGVPILARVPDRQLGLLREEEKHCDVFVGAGHGPWGIALSLGSGKVLAEMLDGTPMEKLSADVQGLGMQ